MGLIQDIAGALQKVKEASSAAALALGFNYRFNKYGTMTNLQIDSLQKTIRCELELKGESSPLQVCVKDYRLAEKDGKFYLEWGEIETSREWISLLLDELMTPRRIEVPKIMKVLL